MGEGQAPSKRCWIGDEWLSVVGFVSSKRGKSSCCRPCSNKRAEKSRDVEILREEGRVEVCAICRDRRAVHAGRDHGAGRVRSMPCFNRNAGLGDFRDGPGLLRAAAGCVEEHFWSEPGEEGRYVPEDRIDPKGTRARFRVLPQEERECARWLTLMPGWPSMLGVPAQRGDVDDRRVTGSGSS